MRICLIGYGYWAKNLARVFGKDLVPGLIYKLYNVKSPGVFETSPFKTQTRHEEINYWWGSGKVLNSGKSDRVGLNISGFIKFPKML